MRDSLIHNNEDVEIIDDDENPPIFGNPREKEDLDGKNRRITGLPQPNTSIGIETRLTELDRICLHGSYA